MTTKKPGTFKKGHDPRRHPLTTEERRRGGKTRSHQLLQEMHEHVYKKKYDQPENS